MLRNVAALRSFLYTNPSLSQYEKQAPRLAELIALRCIEEKFACTRLDYKGRTTNLTH